MASEDYAVAAWLQDQMTLAKAARTGRGVVVTTADGVIGPAIVMAERRGMVALRRGREVQTLRLCDIEAVAWAPGQTPAGAAS